MANKPKGKRIQLGEPLQGELTDFCEAHYGVPQINIIREAVRVFIATRLKAEPEVRKRHEAARKNRLGQTENNIHVIKSDSDK